MRTLTPFDVAVLRTHRSFFVLMHIDAHATDLDVVIDTPSGRIPADFIDLYRMQDDHVVAAWTNPFKHLPHHNVIVTSSQGDEIVNLTQTERILEFYDKPLKNKHGAFGFANSVTIVAPNTNWRCDSGLYGARNFRQVSAVFENVGSIVFAEYVLSLNGGGYVMYLEGENLMALRDSEINHNPLPSSAMTIQEMLKLVDEWAIVHDEPFNNEDSVSAKAKEFMAAMRWSDNELGVIRAYAPMQIARYLSGEQNARQRPDGVQPLDQNLTSALFKRMAHGSLAFANALHGRTLWDHDDLLAAEWAELDAGIGRFRAAYEIPDSVAVSDSNAISAYHVYRDGDLEVEVGPFIQTQARNFRNKTTLLERAANGNLF